MAQGICIEVETSQIARILALKCCEKRQLIPGATSCLEAHPTQKGKATQNNRGQRSALQCTSPNRTSAGHREVAGGGVQIANPRLKDTIRGRRPLIFTYKVSQYVRHLINIKGNGWPRLSLGNAKFW